MRTPPPVLPPETDESPQARSSWLEQFGADSALQGKAVGYGVLVAGVIFGAGLILSLLGGVPSFAVVIGLAVAGLVLGALTAYVGSRMGEGAGIVVQSFIQPSGNSTPYEQSFSYQEAMIMRGDIDGALESFESIITEQPTLVSVRLLAAEHYARGNRNPMRAAELFREIRAIPQVPIRDAIYSSSRLVDLYDGPLADPGRALVELRRIIELYPGSDVAKHARSALPALKERLERERNQ
ncbi:hypothetical protein BH09GEM1_BH09GEM1_26410 [soil metagenome]